MTTVTATTEGSAFTAWGKQLIAKGQEAAAAKAAEKAAAVAAGLAPVEEPSTVVKLSDEAKALNDARDWLTRGMKALKEKWLIEDAKWSNTVQSDSTDTPDTPNSLYGKFRDASALEKEAYVQRRLAKTDYSLASGALYEQYLRLTKQSNSVNYSEDQIATMRLATENGLRIQVNAWSADPNAVRTKVSPDSVRAAPVTARPTPKTQDEQIQLSIDQQRQIMGVTIGGENDPVVQGYIRTAPPGQPSYADQTAAAQQRIDAVKSEFSALAEVWNKAAERGEAWALPKPPAPPSTGYNTFRYEESHQAYLPNIAYMPLERARKSLEFGEFLANTPAILNDTHINSHYGDLAINDIQSYIASVKDHISKLEAGGTYLVYLGVGHSVPADQLNKSPLESTPDSQPKSQSL